MGSVWTPAMHRAHVEEEIMEWRKIGVAALAVTVAGLPVIIGCTGTQKGAAIGGVAGAATGAAVGVCSDLKTGEDIWNERISPGKFIASPIATKERIYWASDTGDVTVVAASSEFKVLARNKLEAGVTASPAVADGAIFIRTKTHLVKIVK